MKKIKVYKTTSFTLEVLRMVLEARANRPIKFGEYSLEVTAEEKHVSALGDHVWQTKTQVFQGDVHMWLPETNAVVSLGCLRASMKLSSISGSWQVHEALMTNHVDGKSEKYRARCKYKPGPLFVFNQVVYPTSIRFF